MNRKDRLDQWFYFADNDLLAALSLFDDGIWNQVCFHSQQVAEKAMKCYLKAGDKHFRKTHSLMELYDLCEKISKKWADFGDNCAYLDRFYIPMRYPDAFVGSLPDGLPNEKDAKTALKMAEEILNFVKSEIEKEKE